MQQAQLQAHGAGEIGVIERGRIVERDLRAEFVSHAGKPQLALNVTQHLRPVQALFLTGDAGFLQLLEKLCPFLDLLLFSTHLTQALFDLVLAVFCHVALLLGFLRIKQAPPGEQAGDDEQEQGADQR